MRRRFAQLLRLSDLLCCYRRTQRNLQRFVSLASGPGGHAAAHTAPSQVPDAFDMESATAYGEDDVPF